MAVNAGIQTQQRRLTYGLNVGLSVVLAAALLVVAVYLAGRVKGQVDL